MDNNDGKFWRDSAIRKLKSKDPCQKEGTISRFFCQMNLWVKMQPKIIIQQLKNMGVSSIAQWCVILVMLYLILAG